MKIDFSSPSYFRLQKNANKVSFGFQVLHIENEPFWTYLQILPKQPFFSICLFKGQGVVYVFFESFQISNNYTCCRINWSQSGRAAFYFHPFFALWTLSLTPFPPVFILSWDGRKIKNFFCELAFCERSKLIKLNDKMRKS